MKKWLATLLTVAMIVALVPFSAISVFAADSTAGTAADLITALGSAESGDTVKLTADVTDTSKTYTVPAGVTLDLDGHKFAYKKVETNAVGARIIDTKAGVYDVYETITTTGDQFVPTGIAASALTGVSANTSLDVSIANGSNGAFTGGYYTGGSDRFHFLMDYSGKADVTKSGLIGLWFNADGGAHKQFVTDSSCPMFNTDGSVNNLGKFFDYNAYLTENGGYAKIQFEGESAKTATKTDGAIFDRSKVATDYNVNLFNGTGDLAKNYANLTEQFTGTFLSEKAQDISYGLKGWRGTTKSAQFFANQLGGNTTADLDFVPAKSTATDMIGVFDKVNGEFYPLLGNVNKASVSNKVALLTLSSDGSFTEKTLIATPAALTAALTAAASATDKTVKLDGDINGAGTSFTIPAGVTLDLNGHTITYKAIETKQLGARVIDSAVGEYEIYDYLFTNGRQFIPLGIKPSELSGAEVELTADAAVKSNNPNGFMGGHFGAGTNRFQVISITYGASTSCGMYCWVSNDTNGSATSNASPVFWNTSGTNKLGEKFGMSFSLDADRKITVKYTGALEKDLGTSSYSVFNPNTKTELNLNILNTSQSIGDTYAKLTASLKSDASGALLAGDFTDTDLGYRGWIGKTYSAKIYKNQFSAATPVADFDFIPAKAPSGMIGLFDKVNGEFYPLLGLVEYASLGEAIGTATKAANGSVTYVVEAADADELKAGMATEGMTVKLTADITDATVAYTMSPDVTVDLNGHKFTYKSVETKDAPGARIIDSAEGKYQFYDYIFTNGRQAIPTGLTPAGVSGFNATWRLERLSADSGPMVLFGGFVQPAAGDPLASKALRFMWSTNQVSDKGVYAPNNTAFYGGWFANTAGTATVTLSQGLYNFDANGVDAYKVFVNEESTVTVDTIVRDGYQNTTYDGVIGHKSTTAKTATLYDRTNPTYNFGLNLLNLSGTAQGSYGNWTTKSAYQWNGLTDTEQGRNGWYGKVYSAKIYNDTSKTEFTTNNEEYLVRNYVPAKSLETGALGMFDKVEGVFYPLLGDVQYASVSETTNGYALIAGENVTYVPASKDNDLQEALDALEAPATYTMTENFTDERAELVVPVGIVLDVAGFDLSVKSFAGSVTDTELSGSITVSATFNGTSADPDNVILNTEGNVTTFSAPADPADELMEDITNNENITVTESVDLTGKGDVEFVADQEITLEADTTLTVDTLTIDAATKISGEGTIVTETLVVNGELENWLPVEVEENTYKFIDTSMGVFDDGESDYFVPDDGETSMGASVFGLTESMTEAIKTVLQDDEYQVVLVATITHHDMLNFENTANGERKESEDSNGTLTLEFDVTNLLKATDQDITDLYVMFTGVNVAYMSNISVNAEFRNANYTLNADRFEDLVSEDLK